MFIKDQKKIKISEMNANKSFKITDKHEYTKKNYK